MTDDELKTALIQADAAVINRALDGELWMFVTEKPGDIWMERSGVWQRHDPDNRSWHFVTPHVTSNLHDAVSMIPEDFWFTGGRCNLSGHVTIGPDYNGPHGARLRQQWPEHIYHEGFSADLEPGGSIARVCLAIGVVMIDMFKAKKELGI